MATSKRKQLKVKTVAQKVKLFRANEPLLSVFMWGINHSISELNHVNVPVMLMPDDFKAYTKVRVDNHMFNKENMPSHFKVKEYCPMVFRNLRERFGIDDADYSNSLTKQPIDVDSPGRSQARMMMSQDKLFYIKVVTSEDIEQMHHLLKQYHQYIVEVHAQTLLPQYLGMYRLTVNDIETYWVVMRNVFSPRLSIHIKYDLKGSTVQRFASDKEKAKDLPTYKDNDFLNDKAIIHIGPEEKEKFMAVLTKDTEFLTSLHLMDFSLIVGIHDFEMAQKEAEEAVPTEECLEEEDCEDEENGFDEDDNQFDSVPTPPDSPHPTNMPPFSGEIDANLEKYAIKSAKESSKEVLYFMALVDILTKYGMKKRSAQAVKTVKHGAGAEISTVRPDQYAKRFLDFIDKCVE